MLLVLLIVLVCTGQGHGSAVLHDAGPFLEFAVIETVYQDGSRIIGQVELHPVLSSGVRAGLEGRYRTGQPVISAFIRPGDEILHRRCRNLRLGIPLRFSVQGIQEGLVGHGLVHRIGRAEQVHVAADDDFVAYLDLRILGREFLVFQVEGTVHVEGFGTILIGDVESTVSELCGIRLGDGRYEALHIHLLRTFGGRILQTVDIGFHACDGIRRFKRTLSVIPDALVSRLVHMDVGLHQADCESNVSRPVVTGIGYGGDGYRLAGERSLPAGRVEGEPIRCARDGPVTGGRERDGLGRSSALERNGRRGHLDVRDTDRLFRLASRECQDGRGCREEQMNAFHRINSFVL